MIFVATKIVSDHIATAAVRTTASEIRWDRLMPQLQGRPGRPGNYWTGDSGVLEHCCQVRRTDLVRRRGRLPLVQ